MQKKIAVIVQRYGKEVNGGAEVHARLLAEQLSRHYDVSVLTSCALDYLTWNPHYPAGESYEDGIRIIRFQNRPRLSNKQQSYWGRRQRGRQLIQKMYKWLGSPAWFRSAFPNAAVTMNDGVKWLEALGPYMPGLLDYLKEQETQYAAFIFITALYYPSAMGVLTVPNKSIFIPTMHDESAIYGQIYQKVMAAPRWILFNTKSEQRFCESLFDLQHSKKKVAGVGIEILRAKLLPDKSVLVQHRITKPYLLYVGRIDKAKGCGKIAEFFIRLRKETGYDLQLVMVGKSLMQLPSHPDLILTGFVDEEVKNQLMLQAKLLLMPSIYESLSLVLLESFGCGVPVIANGRTEVLKDHIHDSNGGWTYNNYEDFKAAVIESLTDEGKRIKKGAAGYDYVKKNYTWEKVLSIFDEAIADVETQCS
jgi:glycosyltransferase involved in cell wall biosynthesis